MHKDPVEYLKHILDERRFIQSVITPELQKNHSLEDETLKLLYGVWRLLAKQPRK